MSAARTNSSSSISLEASPAGGLELVVLEHDVLALGDLEALDDLLVGDLLVLLRSRSACARSAPRRPWTSWKCTDRSSVAEWTLIGTNTPANATVPFQIERGAHGGGLPASWPEVTGSVTKRECQTARMVVTSSRLAAEEWREDDAFEPLTYEKVVGLNNLLRTAWLSRGLELAAPAAGSSHPPGTDRASVIATDLLRTNHHVLPDEDPPPPRPPNSTTRSTGPATSSPCGRHMLDSAHFRTSQVARPTIVRVRHSPGHLFGFVDLSKRGQPAVNDFVSIIQHPQGGTKQIGFTDNKVSAVFGDLLQYLRPTPSRLVRLAGLQPGVGDRRPAPSRRRPRRAGRQEVLHDEGIQIASVMRDAAEFLGISDGLYELAFRRPARRARSPDRRREAPPDPDALAGELLRTRPRFSSVAIDDYSKLNARPGDGAALTLCDRRRGDRRRAAPVGAHRRPRVDPGRGADRPAARCCARRPGQPVPRLGRTARSGRVRRHPGRPAQRSRAGRRDRRGRRCRGPGHRRRAFLRWRRHGGEGYDSASAG